jgi:hypothetical protein
MKRQEYIFTIGFTGNTAMVDGKALKSYGSLGTGALLEKGLYKPALASAVNAGSPEEQALVLKTYNSVAGTSYERIQQLQRVFGLETSPEHIEKIRVLK